MYDLRKRTRREEVEKPIPRVLLPITPKNLKQVTRSLLHPHNGMSSDDGGFLDLDNWMSIHFILEAFSLRPVRHPCVRKIHRVFEGGVGSLESLPITKMVVSSTKRMVASKWRASGKLSMKIAKRTGPSTEPCGTLDVGKSGEEWASDILVTWDCSEI